MQLSIDHLQPSVFRHRKTTAPLQWSEVFVACHPVEGSNKLGVFIGIFGLLLEGWTPENKGVKQVPGIYMLHICCQYILYAVHIFLYEWYELWKNTRMSHVLLTQILQEQILPASCKNLSPPTKTLTVTLQSRHMMPLMAYRSVQVNSCHHFRNNL